MKYQRKNRCTGFIAAIFLFTLVMVPCLGTPTPSTLLYPSTANPPVTIINKELFNERGCHGKYDKSMFETMDQICVDCGQLYEPTILSLCRDECFTTDKFKTCIESFGKQEEIRTYRDKIATLSGERKKLVFKSPELAI